MPACCSVSTRCRVTGLGRAMSKLFRFRELCRCSTNGLLPMGHYPDSQTDSQIPKWMICIAEKHLTHMREKRNRTLLPLGRIGFWLSSPPAGEAEKYLTHMRENKIRSLLPRGVLQGSLLSDPPDQYQSILRMCVRLEFGFSSPEGEPHGKLLPEPNPYQYKTSYACA
jgi:hypothetical protein